MDSHDSDFLIENPRWFYSFKYPHLYGSFYSPTDEENCRIVGWAKRICLLLPKSLISCKMASRNNINLSSFLETVTGAARGSKHEVNISKAQRTTVLSYKQIQDSASVPTEQFNYSPSPAGRGLG